MLIFRRLRSNSCLLYALMLSFMLTGFGTLPILSSASASSYCESVFSRVIRAEAEIRELTFLSYNVQNLFVSVGKHVLQENGQYKLVEGKGPKPKGENEIAEIRNIIRESGADIIVLTEVEGQLALETLARHRLEGRYQPYIVKGNDSRGIEIGFLVKNDLPWSVSIKSHSDIRWQDPVTNREQPLFSRDLPVLEFRRDPGDSKPLFVVIGNHAKSKRDRSGDPESRRLRTAQYDMAAQIVADYQAQKIPVLFGGDFNLDLRVDPEVRVLNRYLKSSLDVAPDALPIESRITHTYHPNDQSTRSSQMDDILVPMNLAPDVVSAKIIRYRDAQDKLLPIPKNSEERQQQPSDHFPVMMTIKTDKLLE